MGVGSYIELYTSLLSWQVYGIIWEGIVTTGIVYVPFMFMVINTMFKVAPRITNFASDESRSDGGVSGLVGELILNIILGFFIILFFAVPTAQLELTDVSYQPRPTAVEETPDAVDATNDPTTLRAGFQALANDVEIPLGWSLIARASSGFTFGVAYSLPRPIDLEESISTLELSNITDPQLAREVPAFYDDCYLPARARLNELVLSNSASPELVTSLESNSLYDRSYMGSLTLLNTAGLYAACPDGDLECGGTLRAQNPVESFPYSAARDTDYTEVDIANGVAGKPICDEWWLSIRDRILDEEEESAETTWEYLRATFGGGVTDAVVEQARVQRVLANSASRANQILGTEVGAQFGYAPNAGVELGLESAVLATGGFFARTATTALAVGEAATTGIEAYSRWRQMSYLKKAVPAVISVMLFVLPILLPFVMLWKMYTVEGVITMAITYFAIRFLSALFEIGVLLEDSLQKSIFGDWGDIAGFVINGGLIDSAEFLLVLAFLLPAIFFLIPAIFLYISMSLGLAAGRGIGGAVTAGTASIGGGTGLRWAGGGLGGK